MNQLLLAALLLSAGFLGAKVDDHVRPTMWGWVWTLEPQPDWPTDVPGVKPASQLVQCPNGDLTLPPWHVRVLYADGAPFWRVFWQERGR